LRSMPHRRVITCDSADAQEQLLQQVRLVMAKGMGA
jgi:hypothetical protein